MSFCLSASHFALWTMLFFNLALLATCFSGGAAGTTPNRRRHAHEEIFLDARSFEASKGTVDCRVGAPRKPIPGIDFVEKSFLGLNPSRGGKKIFDIRQIPSKSCLTYEYEGVDIAHVRTADRSVQKMSAKSVREMVQSSKLNIQASVGFSFKQVDAGCSAGYKHEKTMGTKESQEQKWELASVSQVDNVLSIHPEVDGGPPLSKTFLDFLDEFCFKPVENQETTHQKKATLHETCFPRLFEGYDKVARSLSLGSSTQLVSGLFRIMFLLL